MKKILNKINDFLKQWSALINTVLTVTTVVLAVIAISVSTSLANVSEGNAKLLAEQ